MDTCPGCRYRGLSAAESDRKKQEWAERCLQHLATPLGLLRSAPKRWAYRRKVLLHAERRLEGWAFGLLKRRGRETELIPIPDCPLHAPEINAALSTLRGLLPDDIPLAFVLATGSLLTIVLKCPAEARWRAWAQSLERDLRLQGVEGLQINWNPSAGRRVLSSRHQERVFGPEFLFDGENFHGALSFRQQIPEIEQEALGKAENFLAEASVPRAVDFYCGGGATLKRWTARGWKSLGVELVDEAYRVAQKNTPLADLLKGRVEERLPQVDAWLGGEPFLLYTNPPRDGHASEVLDWILRTRPERIAYLSCNPRTLALDLEALAPTYIAREVQPFDFFPQTDHVEALALLER